MAIDTLLLDGTQELRLLRMALCSPDLPTADIYAICDRALYAIHDLDRFKIELDSMVYDLVHQDHLFAQVALSDVQKQKIWFAIEYLGTSLKNKLVHLQMYEQGILNYHFRELLDDDTFMLQQTRKITHSRLHHPRHAATGSESSGGSVSGSGLQY